MNIFLKLLTASVILSIGCSEQNSIKEKKPDHHTGGGNPHGKNNSTPQAPNIPINETKPFYENKPSNIAPASAAPKMQRKNAKPTFPKINIERKEVRIETTICLADGILEFLTVSRGGRHYEAVFNTECLPSNLHAALLMIGVEPFEKKLGADGNPFVTPEQVAEWNKEALLSLGRIKIEVEYERDGKMLRVDAHAFIKSGEQELTRPQDAWVFTGSKFVQKNNEQIYLADTIDVVISIIHEPAAIIQFASNVGNPYENDKLGFAVLPLPREMLGKKAELIFSPWHE